MIGHRQVTLHNQRQLRLVFDPARHLAGADAEIGPDHEHPHLVSHVVEHRGRIVTVVLYDADIGLSQILEFARQPLPLVHIWNRVIAPGHKLFAIEQ